MASDQPGTQDTAGPFWAAHEHPTIRRLVPDAAARAAVVDSVIAAVRPLIEAEARADERRKVIAELHPQFEREMLGLRDDATTYAQKAIYQAGREAAEYVRQACYRSHAENLRTIAGRFTPGQQVDARELLTAIADAAEAVITQ